ncbi:MAG: hypothetical protein AAF725_25115, partial [Acidobacteriota bacterium]
MTRPRPASPRFRALAVLLAAGALAGCGGPDKVLSDRPLIDEKLPPDVLFESQILDPSPSPTAGNRLLKGWRFEGEREELKVMPDGGRATLEVVQLVSRPRPVRLEIPGAQKITVTPLSEGIFPPEIFSSGSFEVEGESGTFEFRLTGLPAGRAAVELAWPESEPLDLLRSRLGASLPTGEVRVEGEREGEGGSVEQSGYSAVDFARLRDGATELVGRFEQPAGAGAEQRFLIA